MAALDGLLRESLLLVALLCLPILCIATLVGTVIAVLQAATQVQEQTLSLLPKLIVVGIVLILFGSFGMRACVGLFTDVLVHVPALVQG
jgi:flagellar biosynthesis protein FliQ